jgi:hypothetical protein
MVRQNRVRVSGSSPREWAKQGDSGRTIKRSFCGTCGTPLFIALDALPDALGIAAGTLDDPTLFQPGMELWLSSAPPWHQRQPGVAQFEKGPA